MLEYSCIIYVLIKWRLVHIIFPHLFLFAIFQGSLISGTITCYAHLCFGGGLSHLQGTVAHIGGGGGEGSGRADEEGGDRELHLTTISSIGLFGVLESERIGEVHGRTTQLGDRVRHHHKPLATRTKIALSFLVQFVALLFSCSR